MIQQQHTPPEAGPLAASGCCWATSDQVNEQQPFYLFILQLWNHYNSKSFEDYNGNATIPILSWIIHLHSWISKSESSIPSFESPKSSPQIILKILSLSDLCSDLNTKRAESGYNRDNYNMILLQNWFASNHLINKNKANLALQLRFGGRPQQQIWENRA